MMTQKDINMMMDLLVAAYGEKAFPIDDPKKMAKVSNLWSVMFAEDEPAEVAVAVKDCIATLQFPPKIADIKSRMAQNRLAGQMTEMEAWMMIRKAVEDSVSCEKARLAWQSLPEILQRLCNPAQLRAWRTVADEQFETVVCSNVLRSYRTLQSREIGYHALPADIREVESWRIEARGKEEKQPELPKAKPTMQNIAGLIGFEPPAFMFESISEWIAQGLSAAEIRSRILNWGLT